MTNRRTRKTTPAKPARDWREADDTQPEVDDEPTLTEEQGENQPEVCGELVESDLGTFECSREPHDEGNHEAPLPKQGVFPTLQSDKPISHWTSPSTIQWRTYDSD